MSDNLYSTNRKKILCGWFKENNEEAFKYNLKLQKFLFFYETLSKIQHDRYDFAKLKGYANGPVFADVYADYVHRPNEFKEEIERSYHNSLNGIVDGVDEERAEIVSFLVNVQTSEELSDITHNFNIWKIKEPLIIRGDRQVPLDEDDLNNSDIDLMLKLNNLYNKEFIDSVNYMWKNDKCYILDTEDFHNLTDVHHQILFDLSFNTDLINPVYVEISDEGGLLID